MCGPVSAYWRRHRHTRCEAGEEGNPSVHKSNTNAAESLDLDLGTRTPWLPMLAWRRAIRMHVLTGLQELKLGKL